jgi:starvation-inducible DNA-binding protein
MSNLGDSLRVVLADTFALYLKTHNYHWNVEGKDFYEFHIFFELLYNEIWLATDAVAEHIRALDEYAPGSLGRFSELTNIDDATTIPAATVMVRQLLADNDKVIASLKTAYQDAEDAGEIGISNFLQDRTDIHKKHGWMLRATIKDR